jgi:hypothetical protein
MTTSPSKENLAAYEAALASAYTALDAAGASVDLARDDVETTRDEAHAIYGAPEVSNIFSDALSNLNLAARAIADAIEALPALDEDDAEEE